MSAEKIAVSFTLGAILASSFKSNMGEAKSSISVVAQKINELTKKVKTASEGTLISPMQLDKMKKNVELLTRMKNNMKEVKELSSGIKNNFSSAVKSFTAVAGGAIALSLPGFDVKKAEGELATLYTSSKGVTDENAIALIAKSAKKYSSEYAGVTVPEFIKASYDIKSGIASLSAEGVATFTTMSALTSKATKATVTDMTSLFALGYGVYGSQFKTEAEFANKFSNAVSGAVQIFKTDGKDLSEAIGQLGNNATSAGVGLSEQFAVLGVLKTVTKSGSIAATQYNAFLRGAVDSEKMDEVLGVSFTDAKGKLLPLADMLDRIKKQFKGKLETADFTNAMQKAFGDEGAKAVLNLINKTDDLRTSQVQLNGVINEGTLTKAMADAASRGDSLELLKNNLSLVAQEISSALLPTITQLLTFVKEISSALTQWISNNSELIKNITLAVACIVSFVGVVKMTTVVVQSVMLVCKSLAVVFNMLRVGTLALNLVMAANPFVLIGLAVAGVIAGGIALYKNWDVIKVKAKALWVWIKDIFSKGVDFIGFIFRKWLDRIILPFKKIKEGIEWVKNALGIEGGEIVIGDKQSAEASKGFVKTTGAQKFFESQQQKKAMQGKQNVNHTTNIVINGNADKSVVEQAVTAGNNDLTKQITESEPSRLVYE